MNKTIASFIYDCGKFGYSDTINDPDDLNENHKLLILHGGEDISPSIYGEKKGPSDADDLPSVRDYLEMAALDKAIKLGIPVLAICRGAQLACALLGGRLYQDAEGHYGDHGLVVEIGGKIIESSTNSCHHQMMIPDSTAKILGTAGYHQRLRWDAEQYKLDAIFEPEIVYWKDERILGVQGHPEWSHSKGAHDIFAVTTQLLNEKFGV